MRAIADSDRRSRRERVRDRRRLGGSRLRALDDGAVVTVGREQPGDVWVVERHVDQRRIGRRTASRPSFTITAATSAIVVAAERRSVTACSLRICAPARSARIRDACSTSSSRIRSNGWAACRATVSNKTLVLRPGPAGGERNVTKSAPIACLTTKGTTPTLSAPSARQSSASPTVSQSSSVASQIPRASRMASGTVPADANETVAGKKPAIELAAHIEQRRLTVLQVGGRRSRTVWGCADPLDDLLDDDPCDLGRASSPSEGAGQRVELREIARHPLCPHACCVLGFSGTWRGPGPDPPDATGRSRTPDPRRRSLVVPGNASPRPPTHPPGGHQRYTEPGAVRDVARRRVRIASRALRGGLEHHDPPAPDGVGDGNVDVDAEPLRSRRPPPAGSPRRQPARADLSVPPDAPCRPSLPDPGIPAPARRSRRRRPERSRERGSHVEQTSESRVPRSRSLRDSALCMLERQTRQVGKPACQNDRRRRRRERPRPLQREHPLGAPLRDDRHAERRADALNLACSRATPLTLDSESATNIGSS